MGNTINSENLPFPDAGLAVIAGNEKQVANIIHLFSSQTIALVRAELSQIEILKGKYSDLPQVANANFWAKQKMKPNGRPYGARSFEISMIENGFSRTAGGNWHRNDAIHWLES